MTRILAALAAGALFGAGLVLSGMANPAKVLAFLDVAGDWDPSLAFVMGGAVLTALPLFHLAHKRQRPLTGGSYDQPASQAIDGKLIAGAVLFGLGWGLAGICPGPAVVDLILAPAETIVFVFAMVGGIVLSSRLRTAASGKG